MDLRKKIKILLIVHETFTFENIFVPITICESTEIQPFLILNDFLTFLCFSL